MSLLMLLLLAHILFQYVQPAVLKRVQQEGWLRK